jgi:hypothetical protein
MTRITVLAFKFKFTRRDRHGTGPASKVRPAAASALRRRIDLEPCGAAPPSARRRAPGRRSRWVLHARAGTVTGARAGANDGGVVRVRPTIPKSLGRTCLDLPQILRQMSHTRSLL